MSIEATDIRGQDLVRLTTDIVSAYLTNNSVPVAEIPAIIKSIHATLQSFGNESAPATTQKPAVPIKKSVQDDYIVCLEDGAKLKMLKRYLRSRYDMTPEDYRQKWSLPADYPMVAPNYAELRSAFAKKIGLGKIPRHGKRKARRPA
jgi:predicted transcriptional regulator